MFKEFPRIVALGGFYGILGVAVTFFFLFHQYLILMNYTTKEFCSSFCLTIQKKSSERVVSKSVEPECEKTPVQNVHKRTTVVKHGKNIQELLREEQQQKRSRNKNSKSIVAKCTYSNSPYNYGFLLNFLDAFLPKMCYQIRLRLKI